MMVDVLFPQLGNQLRAKQSSPVLLHPDDINPLDIRVIIRSRPVRKAGRIFRDVARLLIVFILMDQAIEITEQLAEQTTPDFIFKNISRDLNKFVREIASATRF
jgi:hypothetical protein